MNAAGIDVSSRKSTVAVLRPFGEVVCLPFDVAHNTDGLAALAEQLKELDGEKMAALPGIAVYMVREGESLWDIGKRYYVPVSVLKQTNDLTSDEVKCGDRILIVKNR